MTSLPRQRQAGNCAQGEGIDMNCCVQGATRRVNLGQISEVWYPDRGRTVIKTS